MLKPISISLSPNVEKDDLILALKLLCRPWSWKKRTKIKAKAKAAELEKEFKNYLGTKHAFAFNSGRSALLAILDSLELEKKDKIILQAFTCNAAVNPIFWSGLEPVYVDCHEKTFNLDIDDLKNKIIFEKTQEKTPRVIMVQHTFGKPAEINEILKICRENNLILIEDCAHSLGAEYLGQKTGTFGKAAFFSFSRDKIISSVYGGIAVTNDDKLAQKIKEYQNKINFPSYFWIAQQLLHPILMNWLILPTYRILGKYLLLLLQRFQILSKAVHWKEKRGLKPGYFPKKLPDALAFLALNQFKKLERFNHHRQKIARFYCQELKNLPFFELPINSSDGKQTFLRFTAKHAKAHEIIKKAWQKNILIGDWYDKVIAPHDTKLDKMKYLPGTCPKAEKLAKETFNLPTHINISQKEAKKIVKFIKSLT